MKLVVAVLMLLTLGTLGEVVDNFSTCNQFFHNRKPPAFESTSPKDSPRRYVKICQKYQKGDRYATLYDTTERIPVFSAYKYEKTTRCKVQRRVMTWMIEPQIHIETAGGEMCLQNHMPRNHLQAYNSDYENSGYNKGHLYPHCHTSSEDTSKSTFTLTNAAPQTCTFNKSWYHKVEKKVRDDLRNCMESFVVTGVVPSTGSEYRTLKENIPVNVPSHFWSAYCCCDNNQCRFKGFIMHRDENKPLEFTSANKFNDNLTNLYKTAFTVWASGGCSGGAHVGEMG